MSQFELFLIFALVSEFLVITFVQKVDNIPVSIFFVSMFLVISKITDVFFIFILLLFYLVIFIFKVFVFDIDPKMKFWEFLFKIAFVFLILLTVFFVNKFFNGNIFIFGAIFLIYSLVFVMIYNGFWNGYLDKNLSSVIYNYLYKKINSDGSLLIDINFTNDLLDKVNLSISNLKNNLLFPGKFLFNEYFLIIFFVIFDCISISFINFLNIDVQKEKTITLFIILFSMILFALIVFVYRILYNKSLYSLSLESLKNVADYNILEKNGELLYENIKVLKENNDKLNNWLSNLGKFYSKLDDNPNYEDLYNSFYSIVSNSLSFSRLLIFISYDDKDILNNLKVVFVKGVDRTDIFIKNTAVEVVVNSLKSVYYFGGTIFSALSLFKDDRSFICSPIKISNKLIGVVYISSFNVRAFNEEDVNFINLFCDKLAIMYVLYREYSKTLNMAVRDGLTGLYTHRYFQELLSKEIENAKLYGYSICLLMIDTDKFKQYNDTFGHPAGDELLINIAKIITSKVKEKGYVCRYGGDEFAVILPRFYKEDAYILAEEIRKSYVVLKRGDIQVSASIGVACFPLDASSKDELIKKADELLYRAKRDGRNRVIMD